MQLGEILSILWPHPLEAGQAFVPTQFCLAITFSIQVVSRFVKMKHGSPF
ncbi:rCG31083 [Rattus norvegicus]|uniref:RCG31083 n=1 Tax=Rattus norvegicus TaxID=10116 RepID=A6IST1_RAT|nr:rCG31083 [Rattus norvegicus]